MSQNANAADTQTHVDDRKARKNVFLLAAAQAFAGANITVNMTLGAIIGVYLADDKTFATVPVTSLIIGTTLTTMPASLYMRKVGRRMGFITGAALGMIGAGLVVFAIWLQSFALLCLGTFLMGSYHAFAQQFRFAAADTASSAFRPKAISFVLAGGVLAAFLGPQIVVHAKDLLAPIQYAGAYAALIAVGFIAIGILSFVDIPNPKKIVYKEPARPLAEIFRQKRLIIALLCGMASYAMMNLVMTATPLAMLANHHGVDDAAFVIQWHVVAMFAPSFFTGNLIARFGPENMMTLGLSLMVGCGVAALAGVDVHDFWIALMLLGLGWNFSFIAATSIVTDCYRLSERNKVQGVNDFAVFGSVAVASLLSGAMFQLYGWNIILVILISVAIVALVLVTLWRFSAGLKAPS